MAITRYLGSAAGVACGAGTRRTLQSSPPSAATADVAAEATWNVDPTENAIASGTWSVQLNLTTGTGGGPGQRVTVTVERLNSACAVQETLFTQELDLTTGSTANYTFSGVVGAAVNFASGDLIRIGVVRTRGSRTQVVNLGANSYLTSPDAYAPPLALNPTTIGRVRTVSDVTATLAALGLSPATIDRLRSVEDPTIDIDTVPTADAILLSSVLTPVNGFVKLNGVLVPFTRHVKLGGVLYPELPAPSWISPPAGMVEWARLELNEGSGTPADTSGNSRVVSIQGGSVRWATEGGDPCLDWNGTDNYYVNIAGNFAPTSKWAIRARVKFIAGGFYGWAFNSFGQGGFELAVQTSNGEHAARSFDVDGSPDFNLTFHSGNVVPINQVIDVMYTYTFSPGNMRQTRYDPSDRTTIVSNSSENGASNAYGVPSTGWVRIGTNGNGRTFRLLDITLYVNE